ncbi:hypothetical protein GCM10025863_09470 [Microbacterium suwonense]|uniref:Uncharacterized protein n=1 Tax=Microbacterium suwonense TaxID=683047 RepID=A0ABN6X2H0_9MICO|nr:hypothetical protein GCM10025863_09470 [Microbacterium suwonense]
MNASGDIGSPQVGLSAPVVTSKPIYDDLIVGDGPAVRESAQNVVGTVTLLNGETGQALQTAAVVWSADTMSTQLGGDGEALLCATEGSRVAFAIPASDLPEGLADQAGLSADGSVVGSIDIQEVLLPRATGRDVFNDARGLPTVVRAADGRPGIIIPGSAAPAKTVVQTLIEGAGQKVGDDVAMFNYTSVDWNSRSMKSTSWDSRVVSDATTLPEAVMTQVAKATVGSQLLVVVPDDSGDSDDASDSRDATAYVVDVLGIVPPELIRG